MLQAIDTDWESCRGGVLSSFFYMTPGAGLEIRMHTALHGQWPTKQPVWLRIYSATCHRAEVKAVIIVLGRMQMVYSAAKNGCQHIATIVSLDELRTVGYV